MKDQLAKIVSGLSSPFLMVGLFGLWSVADSVQSFHDFILYGGLCLLLVAGLPLIYIFISIKLGIITDIHVAIREQRSMPFVVATVGAVILSLLYRYLGAPNQLFAIAVSLVVSGIIFGLITQYWKISIHAAAYSGSVIIVGFIVDQKFLWLLVLLPIVIWARLVRKRHSPSQAVVASILNAICVYITLTLLLH